MHRPTLGLLVRNIMVVLRLLMLFPKLLSSEHPGASGALCVRE
jgi:hypothetical protein